MKRNFQIKSETFFKMKETNEKQIINFFLIFFPLTNFLRRIRICQNYFGPAKIVWSTGHIYFGLLEHLADVCGGTIPSPKYKNR